MKGRIKNWLRLGFREQREPLRESNWRHMPTEQANDISEIREILILMLYVQIVIGAIVIGLMLAVVL